ncbi:ATPase [Scytonema hofmannii PCC 7110]|uniref:ATPase n=1 Tax=Scytonema hofmannii PCC 7110 TaxID=128403 RepID=A0A139WT74_9CYAN|nr:MoxR family ATPase [Scytonema hofmannii]KYC35636.1 ATPase [Scytonema hofmannii PCC 7110]
MTQDSKLIFQGTPENRPKNAHKESPQTAEPYVADAKLKKAVNLAIYLRRPLLLEGEAGCGKTKLARAVAYELGLPFYRWNIRSTTKASEGLYEYDAILRLQDVQIKDVENNSTGKAQSSKRDPSDPKCYRKFGPLGKAFQSPQPAIVLIDEIDKADLDFPNDLLTVLDDPWEFEIPQTQETIEAEHTPIIIVTSNKEKGNLPAPFLRRCIYYFIEFPKDVESLQTIVKAHYQMSPEVETPPENLVETAAKQFLKLRETGGLLKNPGTSEFLDWLQALAKFENPYPVELLKKEYQDNRTPYRELLFKLRADWQKYQPAQEPAA